MLPKTQGAGQYPLRLAELWTQVLKPLVTPISSHSQLLDLNGVMNSGGVAKTNKFRLNRYTPLKVGTSTSLVSKTSVKQQKIAFVQHTQKEAQKREEVLRQALDQGKVVPSHIGQLVAGKSSAAHAVAGPSG